jgi:hypothetical protein
MKSKFIAALIVASLVMSAYSETNLVISSYSGNGKLSWSNAQDTIQYSVEWASSLNGVWTNSWSMLSAIPATSSVYTVDVPMFYRLVAVTATKLLLHCDGTNGAVSFPDAAGGHLVVAVGDAQVSAAQGQFGSAAYFDGSGDCLETADSPDFEPANQAFTIDFWMYPLNDTGPSCLIGKSWPDAGQGYDIRFYLKAIRVVGVNGWAENIIGDASVSTGAWYHVAVSSTTNTVYLFINGIQKGTCARSNMLDTGLPLRVGWTGTGGLTAFHGYMDEVRYSVGIARWTNNFAVPTAPYGDD